MSSQEAFILRQARSSPPATPRFIFFYLLDLVDLFVVSIRHTLPTNCSFSSCVRELLPWPCQWRMAELECFKLQISNTDDIDRQLELRACISVF